MRDSLQACESVRNCQLPHGTGRDSNNVRHVAIRKRNLLAKNSRSSLCYVLIEIHFLNLESKTKFYLSGILLNENIFNSYTYS